MIDFFEKNMDYVFFVYGLSFILIAGLCRGLIRSDPAPRAWRWLLAFGLGNGLSKWLDMLALSLGDTPAFLAFRLALLSVSLVGLVEFGRQTLTIKGRPFCGPWLAPLLTLLVCTAIPEGLPGIGASLRYALGLPGGLLAALALGLSVRREKDDAERRGLLLASLSLALFGLSQIVPPPGPIGPASWLNHESFLAAFGFPVQVLRAVALLGTLAGIWIFRNRLTPEVRSHGKHWLTPLVFVTLIAMGWGAAEWRAQNIDALQRARILEQSASLAQAIHPLDVKELTFTPADRESPRYRRLNAQLAAMHRVFPCRAIYTLSLRNGQIVFGPNSRPSAPPRPVAPGDALRNIDPAQFPVFRNGEPFLVGPAKHADGTSLTAYAPLCDPRSGDTLLLVGMEWPIEAWQQRIAKARLLPIFGAMILLLALLACLDMIHRRDHIDRSRSGRRQHLEALMIVLCGVAATLFFALMVREMEVRKRQAVFDRMADYRASQIRGETFAIRADLAAVARFFENSSRVTPPEFHKFAGALLELNCAESFTYIPAVPDGDLAAFVAEIRKETPSFTVWESDDANRPVAASNRPVHFPILLTVPATHASALGFDLGAEPVRRANLEAVLHSGLPTATGPFPLPNRPQGEPSVIVSYPVAAPGTQAPPEKSRKPLQGFINAVISAQDLLLRVAYHSGVSDRYLEIGLFDLTDGQHYRLLAALPPGGVTESLLTNPDPWSLLNVEPLFVFGRTYVIVSKPSRAFMAGHPIRGNWAVWLVGLLLTATFAVFVAFLRNRQINLETVVRQRTEALEESETQYRLLAEHASDVIGRISLEGRYLYLSPVSRSVLGYDPEELAGRDMMDRVHPDDAKAVLHAFHKMLSQPEAVTVLLRHRHKDGSYRWMETTGKRMLDPETGEPREVIVVSRDISERKRSEEERLEMERRLLHTQKLESLGVLTGGIAHDFNNLLTGVLGNLELAQHDLLPHTPARLNVDHAALAARRAADLTRQMLDYSGKGLFLIKEMNINSLVEENANLLRTAIAKNVTLDLSLTPALPPFRADPGQLQQIIMNLITNASEAIGDHPGRVRLTTGLGDCSAADLAESRLPEKPEPGRFIFIEVSDTGCGMSPETQHRIFEPFFTTKFTGRGLGMSAVLGIMRGHHGALFLKSVPGGGTTIRVLFPAPKAAAPAPARPEPPAKQPDTAAPRDKSAPPPPAGIILIVDDEQYIRSLCNVIVTRSGYRTLLAGDGVEAVQMFEEKSAEILAVILDLTMPRMDGVTAFHEMLRIRPDVKVILSSGHAEQEACRKFDLAGIAGFLQKPYDMQTLEEMLKRVVGTGS